MKIIKIFLASSYEMIEQRRLFEIAVNRLNKKWVKKDMFLELFVWENFGDEMSESGKQKQYDEHVSSSDIFVLMIHKKVGDFSMEELDTAIETYKNSEQKLPKVYTYCIRSKDDLEADDDAKKLERELLVKYKHYLTYHESFGDMKSSFFDQLDDLTNTDKHFSFPDMSPMIEEKVLYIKMILLTNRKNAAEPFYRKKIERLDNEVEVYDEAQFFEMVSYSGMAKETMARNYSFKDAAVDMNVILPRQKPATGADYIGDDAKRADSVEGTINLTSNLFYSATSFYNSFQEGNTVYQTRAQDLIKKLTFIVDFASLPAGTTMHKSLPVARLLSTPYPELLAVSVIKDGIYQVEAAGLSAGQKVEFKFDIDWSKIK